MSVEELVTRPKAFVTVAEAPGARDILSGSELVAAVIVVVAAVPKEHSLKHQLVLLPLSVVLEVWISAPMEASESCAFAYVTVCVPGTSRSHWVPEADDCTRTSLELLSPTQSMFWKV